MNLKKLKQLIIWKEDIIHYCAETSKQTGREAAPAQQLRQPLCHIKVEFFYLLTST